MINEALHCQPLVTIGLLWHSLSSDNLGVGALTESQIAICESAARTAGVRVKYIVFGTQGGSSYIPQCVDIEIGSRISIKQMLTGKSAFLRQLELCDLVLDIGEGDSFADIYGNKRFLFQLASKIAVIAKNKPLILSPQTIGPFKQFWARILVAAIMRRCERVFARDRLSAEYLGKLGVVGNTEEVIDVAFRLPHLLPGPRQEGRLKVGLNVSGLLFSGGYTGSNQFGLTVDYPLLMRKLLASWTQRTDVEIWLVPHVIPDSLPADDDRIAIRALSSEFPEVSVAPSFKSPSEAKSFIAGLDFLTGARMHACIAAFSSGVPVVPLAYSRKFEGLFSSLDYRWVADGTQLSTDAALQKIEQGLASRDVLKVAIDKGNEIARQKLERYESVLAEKLLSHAKSTHGNNGGMVGEAYASRKVDNRKEELTQ